MRAGVIDYLPKPVTGEAMRASLDRARVGLGHGGKEGGGGPKQPGKLYAFYSAKGGAGTTTTATNFAVVLHRITRQEDAAGGPGPRAGRDRAAAGRPAAVQLRGHGAELPPDGRRAAGLVHRAAQLRGAPPVGALPARRRPRWSPAEEIRRILQFLRKHYDYVVVDTSKSFSPATLAAFEQADLAFIVTNVDLASLRNMQRGLPLLKRMLGARRRPYPAGGQPVPQRQRHHARRRGADPGHQGVPDAQQRLRGREPVDHHRQADRAQRQLEVTART